MNINKNNNNENSITSSPPSPTPSKSKKCLFPTKLLQLLSDCEESGNDWIISWMPDGRSFKIHDCEEFSKSIMPQYFRQTKYRSFQRQLNSWGFQRISSRRADIGLYYHPQFIRGQTISCSNFSRTPSTDSHNHPDDYQQRQEQMVAPPVLSSPNQIGISSPLMFSTISSPEPMTIAAEEKVNNNSEQSPITKSRRISLEDIIEQNHMMNLCNFDFTTFDVSCAEAQQQQQEQLRRRDIVEEITKGETDGLNLHTASQLCHVFDEEEDNDDIQMEVTKSMDMLWNDMDQLLMEPLHVDENFWDNANQNL